MFSRREKVIGRSIGFGRTCCKKQEPSSARFRNKLLISTVSPVLSYLRGNRHQKEVYRQGASIHKNLWDETTGTRPREQNHAGVQEIIKDTDRILNAAQERFNNVTGSTAVYHDSQSGFNSSCEQNHPIDPENDADCPGAEWEDEITKDGGCFCKSFFKPERGKNVQS